MCSEMIEVLTPLVEQKWWSRDYGDAAEKQLDRGDQAKGGGEEGGGGKEESRGAGVCSEVQIETLPADFRAYESSAGLQPVLAHNEHQGDLRNLHLVYVYRNFAGTDLLRCHRYVLFWVDMWLNL